MELGVDGGASWPVFSPDGKRIAAFTRNTTRIWNSNTGDQVVSLELADPAIAPARFSPDGWELITLSYGQARIWNVTADLSRVVPRRASRAY
jgi:WD40 repeat protein